MTLYTIVTLLFVVFYGYREFKQNRHYPFWELGVGYTWDHIETHTRPAYLVKSSLVVGTVLWLPIVTYYTSTMEWFLLQVMIGITFIGITLSHDTYLNRMWSRSLRLKEPNYPLRDSTVTLIGVAMLILLCVSVIITGVAIHDAII